MHITKRFDERLNRKMRAAYMHGTVGFQYAYCDCDRGFPGCTGHHAVENQRWRYPASTRIQRERTISSFLGTVNIYLSVNKNTHRTYPQLGCGKPPLSSVVLGANLVPSSSSAHRRMYAATMVSVCSKNPLFRVSVRSLRVRQSSAFLRTPR